jgi:phenylalanyl-tRNA synthetase beta subunit
MSSANKRSPRFSPSKRSPNRIYRGENEKISLEPSDIDELITNFYETKLQLKELKQKEERYRRLIHRLLNVTNTNQIKSRALEVTKRVYRKRILTKQDVPEDIWIGYSRQIEVPMLFIQPL